MNENIFWSNSRNMYGWMSYNKSERFDPWVHRLKHPCCMNCSKKAFSFTYDAAMSLYNITYIIFTIANTMCMYCTECTVYICLTVFEATYVASLVHTTMVSV